MWIEWWKSGEKTKQENMKVMDNLTDQTLLTFAYETSIIYQFRKCCKRFRNEHHHENHCFGELQWSLASRWYHVDLDIPKCWSQAVNETIER